MGPRAALVDRDGTINELVSVSRSGQPESPLHVEEVSLIPGAADALRRLAAGGWLLVGVSNQPAAAKGTARPKQLAEVQTRVIELLAAEGARLDGFRICHTIRRRCCWSSPVRAIAASPPREC